MVSFCLVLVYATSGFEMARKIGSKDIDDITRGKVLAFLQQGLSCRKIAKICGISPSSVSNIKKAMKTAKILVKCDLDAHQSLIM